MTDAPKPDVDQRVRELRQAARAAAEKAGKNWATLTREERATEVKSVRLARQNDRSAKRQERNALGIRGGSDGAEHSKLDGRAKLQD